MVAQATALPAHFCVISIDRIHTSNPATVFRGGLFYVRLLLSSGIWEPPMPDLPRPSLVPEEHVVGQTDGGTSRNSAHGPEGTCATAIPVMPTGRYEIGDEIDRGGMGIVYRAIDTVLGREVAIKSLQEKFCAGGLVARRFMDEARITGQLQHPGIPAVHDLGTLPDGRPFLAMKLIKGRTLDDLLKDRPDPGAERGRFFAAFEQICQALGYAHAHRVIHRDLKPANVMVGNHGEVQVMDWGLAKVRSAPDYDPTSTATEMTAAATEIDSDRDDESATRAGSVLGTPAYMPPEQAIGAVHLIDERSDVFGLGAILAVILTGKPPFVGDSVENTRVRAARGELAECFARLDACGAEPGMVSLAKQCLSTLKEGRPANAEVVARAVADLRADSEQRARQAELEQARAQAETHEQKKRRRVQLALAGSVLALVAVAGIGAWIVQKRDADHETERRVEAAQNRQAAETALDQAEAALRKDNPIYGEIDAALTQVEPRIVVGGLTELQTRHDRLVAARRILDRLDDIDRQRWTVSADDQKIDDEFARVGYPVAFREFGIDLDAGDVSKLVETIRRSPISVPLTEALNAWLEVGGPPKLLDLVDRLDPEPSHVRLRRAFVDKDQATIAGIVTRLDGRALPPAFAQYVGSHKLTPTADATRILIAAQAHHPNHFGVAFYAAFRLNRLDDRIGYYRIALAIRPNNQLCFNNLGKALYEKKDLDGAFAAYQEAIRLNPRFATPHNNIGNVLRDRNDLVGAINAYREAIRLNPKNAGPHANLGSALLARMNVPEAITEFREAVRLRVNFAQTYNFLAVLLSGRGEHRAALQVLRDGLLVNRSWLSDLSTNFRYHLAWRASLAATGAGKDPPPPAERPGLRKEALGWFVADLELWQNQARDPRLKATVHHKMVHWLDNTDLASVRDIEKLPPDERDAWAKLWAAVRKLRDDTASVPLAAPPRPVERMKS